MLTAYENFLIISYLANVAAGLNHRDPEARELIDWVADRENRIVFGAKKRRHRRRHRNPDSVETKISAKK